jgi:hypothetical protein
MRTFHTGGVAGEDITHGLPRVVELFEARKPKGAAVMAESSGVVRLGDSEKGERVITVVGSDGAEEEHVVSRRANLAVRDGREVASRRGEAGTPGELLAGVERWAEGVREIDAGVRVREEGATYGVWPERLSVELLTDDGPKEGWARGLSRRERRRVTRRYNRTLRELAEEGVHCAPALLEARDRHES